MTLEIDVPDDGSPPADDTPVGARNLGKPLPLAEANFNGILAEPARGGEAAVVWTRLLTTSDEALFHQMVPNIASTVEACTRQDRHYV